MMMIQALQHKDEKQVVIIGVYKCGQVNKRDRCIYVSVRMCMCVGLSLDRLLLYIEEKDTSFCTIYDPEI